MSFCSRLFPSKTPAPVVPPGPVMFVLNPINWNITYSVGMSEHPSLSMDNPGWYIDFPVAGSLHYVTSAVNLDISARSYVAASMKISSTDNPTYYPEDGKDYPPCYVHLMMQRTGDNMSGLGQYEFYRWWSNPIAWQLQDGEITLQVPLTIDQWSSVMGRSSSPDTLTGFQGCLSNLGNIGLTFGGSYFFGHGVHIDKGSARFSLISMVAV